MGTNSTPICVVGAVVGGGWPARYALVSALRASMKSPSGTFGMSTASPVSTTRDVSANGGAASV